MRALAESAGGGTTSPPEHLKDLLDGVRYMQIKQQGRKLELVKATTDITKLSPVEYVEATVRHKGMASFNADGNVVGLTDGLYILNWAFNGGAEPPAPFPACGPDAAGVMALGCDTPSCP